MSRAFAMAMMIAVCGACAHHDFAVYAPPTTEGNARTMPVQDEAAALEEFKKDEARGRVVIYGAEWCEPCGQAEAYLKSKGIATRHRDVDKDPTAMREMQTKLAAVGRSGGAIPVLDVYGTILVGFNARAIDEAIQSAQQRR